MSIDPSAVKPTGPPPPPPPLEQRKYALKVEPTDAQQTATENRLREQGLHALGGHGNLWADRKPAIDTWWASMKEAEKKESWDEVYTANRMCVRGINTMPVANLGGWIMADPATGPQARQERIFLSRDADGIVERMQPERFLHEPGAKSAKDKDGLHALSTSLLYSPLDLDKQLKYYTTCIYLFFPVPTERNMQIFSAISGLQGADEAALIAMRSRMTRIEGAATEDMHTRYVYTTSDRGAVSVRYGIIGSYEKKAKPTDTTGAVIAASEVELRSRRTNAMEHSRILGAAATTMVNEVVVSLRKHENPLFPIFAEWDQGDKMFHVGTPVATPEYVTWWAEQRAKPSGTTDGTSAAADGVKQTHTLTRTGARITGRGKYLSPK